MASRARKGTAKKATTTTTTTTTATRDLDAATLDAGADVGQEEVEAKLDAEQDRGYRGFAPGADEDLSVAGVTGDDPPTGTVRDDSGRAVLPTVPTSTEA